jgi:hypothetical protein
MVDLLARIISFRHLVRRRTDVRDDRQRSQINWLILVRGAGQVDRVLALTGLLEEIEVADPHLSPAPS